MNMTNTKQSGFTLIELVVVIVILGILSAVALPRFIGLQVEAGDASANGVAGALGSATAINYARAAVGQAGFVPIISGTTLCSALPPLLVGGALPNNVSFVTPGATITCANPAGAGGATTNSCMVRHLSGTVTGFGATVICTG